MSHVADQRSDTSPFIMKLSFFIEIDKLNITEVLSILRVYVIILHLPICIKSFREIANVTKNFCMVQNFLQMKLLQTAFDVNSL